MSNLLAIFRFGWPYLRRYRTRLFLGIMLGMLFGLSNASFVWATKTLFERMAPTAADSLTPKKEKTGLMLTLDQVQTKLMSTLDDWLPKRLKEGESLTWKQVLGGLLLLPAMVFFRGAVSYGSNYCMTWVSQRVVRDLRLDLLIKLNSLSMDFFNRSTIGDLLGRVNGDTRALYDCMSMGFNDLVKEPITVLSVAVALAITDWKLTVLAVMFVPLIVIPIGRLSKKAKAAFKTSTSAGISQDSLLVEVYASIRIVKAFCLEPFQIERFRAIYHRLVHVGMKGVQSRELINPIIEVISVLGLGGVIIFVANTHRDIPNLVGFLTGFVLLYAPIKKLGALPVFFQPAAVGSERLLQIFAEKPTVVEKSDPIRLKEFKGELKFENVDFAYTNVPVLRDFSCTIPRGFKLGVAGESGSGKSTLMHLIFRFYDPVKGSVKIDGHDLRDVSVSDLRHLMALVSQDIVLFDLTVGENIALGKPGATQAEIEAAARGAYSHDFIMKLPKGYDTRIGETGKTLSGGQRQRIQIARALIRNAPILVLDEATANLDSEAEAQVQAAIDRLEEERTVICVAHRLSTLANTDKIVVLHEGRIVEQGHYKELLKAGGRFADLARKQGIISRD